MHVNHDYWRPESISLLIEVVTSEAPDLLRMVILILQNSIAAGGLTELSNRWGIEADPQAKPAERERASEELALAALTSTAKLDRMERLRSSWQPSRTRRGRSIVLIPSVSAVVDLARARAGRVGGGRAKRLHVILDKLGPLLLDENTSRMIAEFMSEPSNPEPG